MSASDHLCSSKRVTPSGELKLGVALGKYAATRADGGKSEADDCSDPPSVENAPAKQSTNPSFEDVRVLMTSNENKMSDGGRGRVLLGVFVLKSSQMWTHDGPPFAPSHG